MSGPSVADILFGEEIERQPGGRALMPTALRRRDRHSAGPSPRNAEDELVSEERVSGDLHLHKLPGCGRVERDVPEVKDDEPSSF